MPTVLELFYSRRSRYNRAVTDPGFDSLPPPPTVDRSHNHNQSRRHHNSDGCDPLLCLTPRHFRHRSSLPERAPVGLEQGGTHPGSGNGVPGSSGGLSGNERLPGSVLLARERLLERLRGMPPSETRNWEFGCWLYISARSGLCVETCIGDFRVRIGLHNYHLAVKFYHKTDILRFVHQLYESGIEHCIFTVVGYYMVMT